MCDNCLETDEFAVLPIAAAAAKYDLRERELYDLIILCVSSFYADVNLIAGDSEWVNPSRTSKRPIRLVSDALAQQMYAPLSVSLPRLAPASIRDP